jgi:pimeloyl-ACP methyl ester carboxylesterase
MQEPWQVWLQTSAALPGRELGFLELPWSSADDDRWAETRRPAYWLGQGLALAPAPLAALVGHSFGANATLQWLEESADGGPEAIVLVSPFFRNACQPFNWRLIERHLHSLIPLIEEGLSAHRMRGVPRSRVALAAARLCERIGPMAFVRFVELLARSDRLRLEGRPRRFLIIGGERDSHSSPADCRALAALLPNAEVAIIPGCGHFCMLEEPSLFAAAIAAFIDRPVAGRSGPGGCE